MLSYLRQKSPRQLFASIVQEAPRVLNNQILDNLDHAFSRLRQIYTSIASAHSCGHAPRMHCHQGDFMP